MAIPDLGRYTEEETIEIAKEALNNLTLEHKLKVVLATFDQNEKAELASWLDEPEEEGD